MRAQLKITQTADIDAAIEVSRQATFKFRDGQVRKVSLRTDAGARALSTLITNLGKEGSLDDAILATAIATDEIPGLRGDTLGSILEVYDLIEQTALNGVPDPAIVVTFH